MKNLKTLLATAAAIAISSSAAHAVDAPATTGTDGGERSFKYSANDITAIENADFANLDTESVTQATNVTVKPYLYVKGTFGGDWELNGWDATKSEEKSSTIEVFHNMDMSISYSGFGNPKGAAGTPTANHELVLEMSKDYDTALPTSGPNPAMGAAEQFNGLSDSANMADTRGYIQLIFKQKLSAPSSSPAGVYSVTPTITFTSNAPTSAPSP